MSRRPTSVGSALAAFASRPRVLRLECGVQHYGWGGHDAIPELLGIENPGGDPFAELWIGAHPDLPSEVVLEPDVPTPVRIGLDRMIAVLPGPILGEGTADRFEQRLPFLLKILSAREPLSIQAHPNRDQAQEGFGRETARGIGLTDPARNYRDANHKPELICALSAFYALRGFRPLGELVATLRAIPELEAWGRRLAPTCESLASVYRDLMLLSQRQVDALLAPLVERLRGEAERRPPTRQEPAYWILRADATFCPEAHKDRGLFAFLLLNLVQLRPGEAMYLPAGELHAYLEGLGVEVMANSNNVLRGGLTGKHVDVPELLRVLSFTSGAPQVLRPVAAVAGEQVYRAPAREFELTRVELVPGRAYRRTGLAVCLGIVTEGEVQVASGPPGESPEPLALRRGEAFLVPSELPCEWTSSGGGVVFQARVPADPARA